MHSTLGEYCKIVCCRVFNVLHTYVRYVQAILESKLDSKTKAEDECVFFSLQHYAMLKHRHYTVRYLQQYHHVLTRVFKIISSVHVIP